MSDNGFSRPDLWEKALKEYNKPIIGIWSTYEIWRIYNKLLKESENKK